MDKPAVEQIEEYQAGLNGTASYDVISKPKHYMLFDEMEVKERAFEGQGVEVRDIIFKLVEKMDGGGEGCLGYEPMMYADYVQLMQYLMRFMDKNGVEDLKKARWYLDKMIDAY